MQNLHPFVPQPCECVERDHWSAFRLFLQNYMRTPLAVFLDSTILPIVSETITAIACAQESNFHGQRYRRGQYHWHLHYEKENAEPPHPHSDQEIHGRIEYDEFANPRIGE